MAVTETTRESWGSRLGGSLRGVVIGLALFIAGFPLLFWNEGNYGIESAVDNVNLEDANVFKGRINAPYLNAFLSMKYSEKATLDAGKLNALRQAVGLPMQGTIVSKVDMFGNRYPLEDALKLFGAMSGKGAQTIK